MKKLITLAVLLGGLFTLTSCSSTGALSGIGGAGESWRFVNPRVSIAGTTLLITADSWEHIGTNGFPLSGSNSLPTVIVGTPTK